MVLSQDRNWPTDSSSKAVFSALSIAAGGHLADVLRRHLQGDSALDVLQVAEHEDPQRERHGIAAAGRARSADVIDELFIREFGKFKLCSLAKVSVSQGVLG